MIICGVIPARFGASRFPGKPLKEIAGKPMIQWVIEGAQQSRALSELYVATDHADIARIAADCGAKAVMTDSQLPSGSDRVWAAIKDKNIDVVINIQGDEPLITGEVIDALAEPFQNNSDLEMATLGREIDQESLLSPNTAKIVINANGEALYFSRFPIPFSRDNATQNTSGCLKHIGLYAYKKAFLKRFCDQQPVGIEVYEGLEQLRALYLGAKIKVVKVSHESRGVDTPEDVKVIEDILKARGHNGS